MYETEDKSLTLATFWLDFSLNTYFKEINKFGCLHSSSIYTEYETKVAVLIGTNVSKFSQKMMRFRRMKDCL